MFDDLTWTVSDNNSLVLLVLLNPNSRSGKTLVQPAVDSGQPDDNTVLLFEFLAYLLAAPAKLVTDIYDLLDGYFWCPAFLPTLFGHELAAYELSNAKTFDAFQPAIYRSSVLTHYLSYLMNR